MITPIVVREHKSVTVPGLPADVARTFAATGAVAVSRDLEGAVCLAASSTVGVVRAGDFELVIRPKVGVGRLLWLVGHARDQKGWRDDDVDLAETDDLVTGLAVAFTRRAGRALAAGVLRGYQPVAETSPVLRGRLREADQLRARLGRAYPLEVAYDDYSADIPENRILLGATRRLLRLPGIPAATRAALHRLNVGLAEVAPLPAGLRAPATPETRLNRRYQSALRLARLVLDHRGLDIPAADSPAGPTLAATGFLFDMNRVYEDWLTAVLRTALEHHGGAVEGQKVIRLDEAGKLAPRPDITWWHGDQCAAVLDAKYKAPNKGFPSEDVYQLIAYCTALDLAEGHLIYAGGTPDVHVIRGQGPRIHVHVLDLARDPSDLLQQIDYLAGHVAACRTRTPAFS
ncbi:restriction endonuclease [Frankia sp. CNm7]|uniref:Restriction endonuclease n=1 Tax=Frankia nepalensis TaxID=1836974 RepID=A0A937RMN9_9ACTN|nr:restriction endonuclease [Frankia nepalensis]MBL7496148.1 restriction endonuclease [Frankia nepalensis]MBL7508913.1 restriction endonuclease [Frankia nepalensis]MBL7516753.1 restriction endonuclease [Frankia nepalensis]MBL7628691.1 restriction endonuclease [Frankia nepalensis]